MRPDEGEDIAVDRLDATVSGWVQGVGFRAFVVRKARSLQLTGFVKNKNDGTVQVRAFGHKRELEVLVEYLSVGPPAGRVDVVDVRWSGPVDAGAPQSFTTMR